MIRDIQNLVENDPEQVNNKLRALEKASAEVEIIEEEAINEKVILDEQSINIANLKDLNNWNNRFDDMNNNVESDYTNGDMNGYHDKDFTNKAQHIVSKGYTAKRKDEIPLPIGTDVCVLDEKQGEVL